MIPHGFPTIPDGWGSVKPSASVTSIVDAAIGRWGALQLRHRGLAGDLDRSMRKGADYRLWSTS